MLYKSERCKKSDCLLEYNTKENAAKGEHYQNVTAKTLRDSDRLRGRCEMTKVFGVKGMVLIGMAG